MSPGTPVGAMDRTASPGYQAPAYSPRTLTSSPAAPSPSAPMPQSGMAPYGNSGYRDSYANDDGYTPSASELARWNAPSVLAFRRKLGPYIFISVPMLVMSAVADSSFGGIVTLWTVYIAWKYAKLWSDGFDWRDVLRQPRHRMFGEVISDLADSVSATFSRSKREQLRAQGRLRNNTLSNLLRPGTPMPGAVRDSELGPYLALVQGARADREEIGRLISTLPNNERARIPDLAATAVDLVNKVESIARDLARVERDQPAMSSDAVDREIASLEAEANPLDTTRSEARVRRLAQLRRDRRAILDTQKKLEVRRGQLESCRLALENVRLDLVRLRTGNSSVQSVTLVAEQAMAMARDVDIVVQAATEVRNMTAARAGVA
jgi:eukaryotic-like serine/threonine-protein kinase